VAKRALSSIWSNPRDDSYGDWRQGGVLARISGVTLGDDFSGVINFH
jgi:hypothetical protein